MSDDRLQFLLKARLDNLWQILAVHIARLAVRHRADHIVGTRNHRRVEIIRYRLEALDHIADFTWIRHDGLVRRLFAEIGKLLEHLLRRPQEERRLQLSIFKSFALHENCTVNAVFLIEKMDVARRDEHLAEFLCKCRNL